MPGRLSLSAVLVALLVLVGLSTAGPASAATFVVKNTNDSGPDSLRAAIDAANATGVADTIKFNIPGAGGHVITLASPLPAIDQPAVVNGQTQPGFAGQPLVRLDNGTGNASALGLDLTAGSSKVMGLSITGFGTEIRLQNGGGGTVSGCWLGLDLAGAPAGGGGGVVILDSASNVVGGTSATARNVIAGAAAGQGVTILAGSSGNRVEGNYIGTDVAGRTKVPNSGGVAVSGDGNTIGGTGAGARNVVSGNVSDGVSLLSGATGNVVEGNYIGLTASGKARLGNGQNGVRVTQADANTIGGTSSGARNVISGNGLGVSITSASSNVVEGNSIGTDPTGTLAIGNTGGGVAITNAAGNTIGGTSAGAGNLISGNRGGNGVVISGGSGDAVQGNWIGVDATGASILRNNQGVLILGGTNHAIGGPVAGAGNVISGSVGEAVKVQNGATGTKIQGNRIGLAATGGAVLGNGAIGIALRAASGSAVGGTGAAANTIAGSVLEGVLVDGQQGPATGNAISQNSIFDNGTAGIELANGGNHLQAAPTITSATTATGATKVGLDLAVVAGASYVIELFANPNCDPSQPPQGRQFLAAQKVAAKTTGTASISISVPALASEEGITATDTRRDTVDTSEFSACVQAP